NNMVTLFNDLPNLSIIELYSYLSSIDILCSFNNLNSRITRLLIERNNNRHVNLSSSRYKQFVRYLSLLRYNDIESLFIDCYASPLQLTYFPYLPNLRILKIKDLREFIDVFNFARKHARTLTHLTVELNQYFKTVSRIQNYLNKK
ncbi:unnamed protein product, partial [Rotaria sp. Silwood2]